MRAVPNCCQHRGGGNDGLARPDITLKQTAHRRGLFYVAHDLIQCAFLGAGQFKRKRRDEIGKVLLVESERFARLFAPSPALLKDTDLNNKEFFKC